MTFLFIFKLIATTRNDNSKTNQFESRKIMIGRLSSEGKKLKSTNQVALCAEHTLSWMIPHGFPAVLWLTLLKRTTRIFFLFLSTFFSFLFMFLVRLSENVRREKPYLNSIIISPLKFTATFHSVIVGFFF